MSDSQIEITTVENSELHALIIEGQTHIYWLDLYKKLGLSSKHAGDVISRLTEGIHYRRFDREEIKAILDSVTVTVVLPPVRAYYFLTSEGWNRAIIEITESRLNNTEVAERISKLKDKMASVFTRYQSGETLSLAADQTPALVGEVAPAGDELAEAEKRIKLYNTARKVAISLGADRRAINTVMIEKVKEECPDVYPFMAMIPQEDMKDSPSDAILSRQEVSKILKVELKALEERVVQVGWALRAAYGWALTPKGTKYLKPDPKIGEKKVWYDIKFSLDAIHLLKREFEQQLLTGGYVAGCCSRGVMAITGGE